MSNWNKTFDRSRNLLRFSVSSRHHDDQKEKVRRFDFLPEQTQAIACDCRQCLVVVYGVPTRPFSCHRKLSPPLNPILQPWLSFFLTWASVYFTAGILNSCRAASVFRALLDHPDIHLIFQRSPTIIQNFHIESFSFRLVQFVPADDIHIYHVSNDDFFMVMFFLGIHTSSCCDYRSNVDLVHFIWQLLERISMK